jgi:hypothetical protein
MTFFLGKKERAEIQDRIPPWDATTCVQKKKFAAAIKLFF